jgi:DtxR family Mn-dependent transcriptional regulator
VIHILLALPNFFRREEKLMEMAKGLTASLEDYLEAIYHIIAEKEAVRAKDISRRLKVSGASVTGALRSLAEKRLVNYAPYDVITLTAEGGRLAKEVVRRHEVLRDFFVKVLAVEEKAANEVACQMEHIVSKEILERFIQFTEFVEVCPRGGSKWIAGFGYYCDHTGAMENCERCLQLALEEARKAKREGGHEMARSAKLSELKPGQRCRVVKLSARGETSKRLAQMGVTPGAVVEVERVAPLGDPIDIKVKGYHLSLRKEEALGVEAEVIEP